MLEDGRSWERDKADFIAGRAAAGDPAYSPLARQLAEFSRRLLVAGSVADALSHVAVAAAEILPDADVVSLTLRLGDGKLHTPVETATLATELDSLQNLYDEGPCLDAARVPGPAYRHSGDLAVDPEWPRFGPAAAALGIHSALSTALLPEGKVSGALNIFSRTRGGLSAEADRDRALLLATHATLAIASTEAIRLAELREVQLRNAIASRDIIGQAKGILMNRRGISADEAFELLRRTSQDLNVRLAEIARTIADRHLEL